MEQATLDDALEQVSRGDLADLIPGAPGRAIMGAFALIEIAEEEIAAAQARTPGMAEEIDASFLALRPPANGLFHGDRRKAYRRHVRELLGRVERDGFDADLGRGTSAEACVALSRMSMAAPLKHEAYTAYTVCFLDAFGEDVALDVLGPEAVRRADEDREKHLVAEHISRVKDKLHDPHREADWDRKKPDLAGIR